MLDDITLLVKGDGVVHVTGFIELEPEGGMPFDDDEDDEEEEEEEL